MGIRATVNINRNVQQKHEAAGGGGGGGGWSIVDPSNLLQQHLTSALICNTVSSRRGLANREDTLTIEVTGSSDQLLY
jgi:hypothetical protein